MFKLFKKRTKTNEESIFPDARDMHDATISAWPTESAEQILREIERRKISGYPFAFFSGANIARKTYKQLRKKHYYVQISATVEGVPCFTVSW